MGISLIHNVFIILDRFTLANRNRTQRKAASHRGASVSPEPASAGQVG